MRPPRERGLLGPLLNAAAPLDLRILGRTLLHAATVGLGAGLIGAGFFVCLEVVQRLLLEDLCGYVPLRAHGEGLLPAALSHGIGSETQKPLAIVVIGGALVLALLPRLLQPALLVLAHARAPLVPPPQKTDSPE